MLAVSMVVRFVSVINWKITECANEKLPLLMKRGY